VVLDEIHKVTRCFSLTREMVADALETGVCDCLLVLTLNREAFEIPAFHFRFRNPQSAIQNLYDLPAIVCRSGEAGGPYLSQLSWHNAG